MSDGHSHGDAHGHEHATAHDHDDFDPEPATSLSEGEPRTPSWLPVLGAGLFLLGAVWFLAGDGTAAPAAASANAAATGAAPVAPKRTAVPTAQAAGSAARPTPPQDPAERQRIVDALKKRREEAKKVPVPAPTAKP